MFRLFKRIAASLSENRRKRLLPESRFVVEVTDTGIINHRPNGQVERVAFADLKAVIIETDDSGPWGADVWWFLVGNGPESGCVYPNGATGEGEALQALQRLPGFDNEQLIQAMSSTDNARFLCWKAPEENLF
jgi:hypothetical protein